MQSISLELICSEGEGQFVEFKGKPAQLDREIVAFANAQGGYIFIGIQDNGTIVGINITNGLKSQITDIAYNCDPSIRVQLIDFKKESVLAIQVQAGVDKPYKCKDGFFTRNGPSCQKLTRDEIIVMMNDSGKVRFDESISNKFNLNQDFSTSALRSYLHTCEIKSKAKSNDVLLSLNVAIEKQDSVHMTNAGVLFFAKHPQQWFPESYITAIRYKSIDRFAILDKRDFFGPPIEQINPVLDFLTRHMSIEAIITAHSPKRIDAYEYPLVALREAIVNAIVHRDYNYDSSHIYIHMYSDRLEIENPGGLYSGLKEEQLGTKSVRRNRLIADLFHRAKFIERVGSGIDRMKTALEENNNPPFEISVSNFFNIRFFPRIRNFQINELTHRQLQIYQLLNEKIGRSKHALALILKTSDDTILREIKILMELKLISKTGVGRSTIYKKIT